jgi:hypothetical protein
MLSPPPNLVRFWLNPATGESEVGSTVTLTNGLSAGEQHSLRAAGRPGRSNAGTGLASTTYPDPGPP